MSKTIVSNMTHIERIDYYRSQLAFWEGIPKDGAYRSRKKRNITYAKNQLTKLGVKA